MFANVNRALQYLALTPAVVQLVFVLVQLFETEGNGEAKKKAVLDTIEMVYTQTIAVVSLTVGKEYVLRVAEAAITIAVNFYNLVGLFKKAPTGA